MSTLSIVVITLNEAQRIGQLLGDLSQQSYRDFEVLLIDSNSDDETCEIAAQFHDQLPQLTIHRMQDRGASLGRNTGAKLANYPRLLFLDADVRLPRDFLKHALNRLEKTGLEVAGVYIGSKGLPIHYRAGYALINVGFFMTQFVFPTAVGACIFSSQRIHQDIQGFDEDIILCEDCDYVNRAARTWRFRFLPMTFQFDPRRLAQTGLFNTGMIYLRANLHRIFIGELKNNEIHYEFGHYDDLSGRTTPETLRETLRQKLAGLIQRFKTSP